MNVPLIQAQKHHSLGLEGAPMADLNQSTWQGEAFISASPGSWQSQPRGKGVCDEGSIRHVLPLPHGCGHTRLFFLRFFQTKHWISLGSVVLCGNKDYRHDSIRLTAQLLIVKTPRKYHEKKRVFIVKKDRVRKYPSPDMFSLVIFPLLQ